jgi:hypothetical protein
LLAGLVRAVAVVVAGVLSEDRPEVPFVVDEHPVGALGSRSAPTARHSSSPAARGGVLTIRTPWLARISSKALVNLASRSRMRKRNSAILPSRSMTRLRPCCAVHVPSGWAVNAEDMHVPGRHLHDKQHSVESGLSWLSVFALSDISDGQQGDGGRGPDQARTRSHKP